MSADIKASEIVSVGAEIAINIVDSETKQEMSRQVTPLIMKGSDDKSVPLLYARNYEEARFIYLALKLYEDHDLVTACMNLVGIFLDEGIHFEGEALFSYKQAIGVLVKRIEKANAPGF